MKKYFKWAFIVVGTTIVGNLAWDALRYFFPMAMTSIVKAMMSISSSYTLYLYSYVGRADKNAYSGLLFHIVYGVVVGLVLLYITLMFLEYRATERRIERLKSKITNPEPTLPSKQRSLEEELKELAGLHRSSLKKVCLKSLYSIASLLFLVLNVSSITYQQKLVVKLERAIEIVAPYVSDQQMKEYRSRFRLIDSKELYDSLIDDIDNVARDNGIKIPKT